MKDDSSDARKKKGYSDGEVPPDPTPGEPGVDARNQQWLEEQRKAERDRSVKDKPKPAPAGT